MQESIPSIAMRLSMLHIGKLKCNLALNILSTFHSPPLRKLKVLTVTEEFLLSNGAEIPISK
jgi:hypothetical protein